MRASCVVPLLTWAGAVSAATVIYEWTIDWVTAAPDGYSRPVIGINQQWPCPLIEANVGDTVVVHLYNNLGNETTGLHFHGIRQYGSPQMDGAVAAAQCPVPPGSSFTYEFVVDLAGTFWYHSHVMGQYPDGLRGPLIVHDPEEPCEGVDQEVVLTVSDWYHEQSIPLVQTMLDPNNTLFAPPVPNSLIVNEGGSSQITFEKGKTYRLRIINFSALAGAMITFQDHAMQVIMQDGSYITPTYANQLRLTPAQRYDVLLTPNADDAGNYPFLVALDINVDYLSPGVTTQAISWPFNQTGYLVGDASAPTTAVEVVGAFNVTDDSTFTNRDLSPALGPVTQHIQIDFDFCLDANDVPRACMNGKPYVDQKVPTLYSVATTGTSNTDPVIYGQVNPFIVAKGNIVELVVNNLGAASHPFHLHGHQFQVIARAASGVGKWPGGGDTTTTAPAYPASKDTINVNGYSYAVIRFTADNPGVWLFHCHIEWHVEMGMTATIIEGPEELRGLQIPQDHIEVCKVQGLPYEGNAAGNTENYTDTSGMNFVMDPTYTGALWESTATQASSSTSSAGSTSKTSTFSTGSTSTLSTYSTKPTSVTSTYSAKPTSATSTYSAKPTSATSTSSARFTSSTKTTATSTTASNSKPSTGNYGSRPDGSDWNSGGSGSWWSWLSKARL